MRHQTVIYTQSARIDDLLDDYVSWREACAAVTEAYQNWQRAGRDERTLAFSDYVAALNREEATANVYQQAVQDARRLSIG